MINVISNVEICKQRVTVLFIITHFCFLHTGDRYCCECQSLLSQSSKTFPCGKGCGSAACNVECRRLFLSRLRDHNRVCEIATSARALLILRSSASLQTAYLDIVWETRDTELPVGDLMMLFSIAYAVARRIDKDGETAEITKEFACFLYDLGLFDDSMLFTDESLMLCTRVYGDVHEMTARRMFSKGAVFGAQNRDVEALFWYEKALDTYRQIYTDINHVCVYSCLYAIGSTFFNLNLFDEAIDSFTKALDVQIQLCGGDGGGGVENAETAKTLTALANAQKSGGNFTDSLLNLHRSLTVSVSIYGERSDEVASCYFDIGDVLTCRKQLDLTHKCFSRSIAIFEMLYGKQNRRIAYVLCDIGDVLLEHGYVHEAMEKFEAALRIFVHMFGDDSCHIQEYCECRERLDLYASESGQIW
jgi:tetratricopeptide (TPR) repeat protein